MKSLVKVLFSILALGALLCPQVVLADGMILPMEAETGYLAVMYHHVSVDIEETHALTRVEQAFRNPHAFDVTARYLFPIPPAAMLTAFEASFHGRAQTVTRQDASTTNASLATLVSERHDPSLLRFYDWETLTFEVTVPAGATRKMVLEYEEMLAPRGGMLHYHYVLGTERYSSALLEEVSIVVNASASNGIGTLYSSSHPLAIEPLTNGRVQARWHAEQVRPTEDFHLFVAPAEGGYGSGLVTGRVPSLGPNTQDHFLFLFSPLRGELETRHALPKDIVFVVDRSGSMMGEKMVQAQDALQFILGQLNDQDRFSIVGFDDRMDVLATSLQPVTPDALRKARTFVREVYARGSTNIDAALERGLEILSISEHRPGATRVVIFLTDGLPTAGITDPYEIADRARHYNARVEARIHVFGVGYDVDTHLLDRLAEQNGGSVTYVQPGENLELVLSEFWGRIATPLLTDLEMTFDGIEVSDLHPAKLPDMFAGSSLLLSGRYRPTEANRQGTLTVTGRAGEERRTFVYTFNLAETGDHAFVPRLWATRQIGRLLDTVRTEGETEALIEEIRALGLTYGLVTPYTTFVIAAQIAGAASMENMVLYSNRGALNQAFGEITVQARVQNQMYQQAGQANLAAGANVTQSGIQNLAQVNRQHIDLNLLREKADPGSLVTDEWITDNIPADLVIDFGSEAYFDLARDPEARAFLQVGNNVLFRYKGEIIQVWDEHAPESVFELQALDAFSNTGSQTASGNWQPLDNRAWPQQPGNGQSQPRGLLAAARVILVNLIQAALRAIFR
jgi:Ca-activated chloride channel homolog